MWSHRYRETSLAVRSDETNRCTVFHNPATRLPFAAYPAHPFAPGRVAPAITVHNSPARRTSIGERGQLIIGDGPDHLARSQCPRCGAATRQPCEALRP